MTEVRIKEFHTRSVDPPLRYLDAEPVAEVVDVLGVVLHQRHVITRHHNVQRPVRRFRGSRNWFDLEFVLLFLRLTRHLSFPGSLILKSELY